MSNASETPRSTGEGTGNGSIRVLHVDDDPDFATLAATFVEQQDDRFDVESVPGASEALDRLAAADFDCVVSDYDMPGRNGIEFLEALRDTHPEVPFILFTGKGSEEVASDAISAGVTDYLQKETGTEQYAVLANRIRNAVKRSRVERERRRQLDAIETAQEGISILDEDGEYIYVNRAYADLYGYDPADIVGEHWELLYPDDETERTHEEILPAVERDGQWHGTTTGLRADGTTFVEDHRLSRTERGELICTVQDRSERERYERELEAERLFIDQALDLLNEVFYVLDDDGGLRRWNERLPAVTGYTDEEIAGMGATEFFPGGRAGEGRRRDPGDDHERRHPPRGRVPHGRRSADSLRVHRPAADRCRRGPDRPRRHRPGHHRPQATGGPARDARRQPSGNGLPVCERARLADGDGRRRGRAVDRLSPVNVRDPGGVLWRHRHPSRGSRRGVGGGPARPRGGRVLRVHLPHPDGGRHRKAGLGAGVWNPVGGRRPGGPRGLRHRPPDGDGYPPDGPGT